jgi:hypothetical protein
MKKNLTFTILLIFNFAFSNTTDDNSVTITTIGNGTTFEKSRESALLSAISQVCGVYISQDSKIFNDQLIKDEIISITKGNIEKYSILSEVKIDNGDCVSTLKVIVSVFNLKTYMESKGYNVDFNGAAFAMNMNLKILNEQAESKAITSMIFYLDKIAENSFDFEINASDPVSTDGSNNSWKIPLTVYVKPNSGFKTIPEYLVNTLKGICLTEDEKNNYLALNKNLYVVNIQKMKNSCNSNYDTFYLRNEKSALEIATFILSFQERLTNFIISDGNSSIQNYNDFKLIEDNFRIAANYWGGQFLSPKSIFSLEKSVSTSTFRENQLTYFIARKSAVVDNSNGYFPGIYIKKPDNSTYLNLNGFVFQFNEISYKNNAIILQMTDIKTLEEIKKVKEYTISRK